MTFRFFAAGGCIAVLLSGASSIASAQDASSPPVNHGPPVPNVCVFSAENAIGASSVGKAIGTRMQQIVAQVNAELNAEKTAIDTEAKSLDAQKASLDQASLQRRANDLNTKANNLQRKAALRDREVSATEQKQVGRVIREMEPLVRNAYQAKACSILLNGAAVTLANPAMDLTPGVVTALNGKLSTLAFDRERLDQPAPQPAK
jgi:Skp family chaperone for outer membrane proteins